MQNEHELQNMRLLAHSKLQGFPNLGEGMALQQTRDGRRVMWLAHEGEKDFTGVDVSDPSSPRVFVQTDLPGPHLRSNSLALVGDILYVARQAASPGETGVGMELFDVSRPEEPRSVGFFDVSGPGSRGTHCLWAVDGNYAHLSTSMPDATPRHRRDDQFYVSVDVSDPIRPVEAGRWWVPGTMDGDAADPPERHEPDMGYGVHNTNVYPARPHRAYCGFKDAGVIILDISDMAHPQEISRVDYHPPMPAPAFTHTVLPLFERELMIVTDEAMSAEGKDWPKLTWLMDMSTESNPVTLSTLPLPPVEEMRKRWGRFGAHNVHENPPVPTALISETLVFGTYFAAGLRVHDVSNPLRPVEVASFIPRLEEDPGLTPFYGQHSTAEMGINDVYVDEHGVVYAADRLRGGLYILELTI